MKKVMENDKQQLVELLQESNKEVWNLINMSCCEERLKLLEKINEHRADYLLANGVIVPPCKVGDTVWCIVNDIEKVLEGRVRRITISDGFMNVYCGVKGYYEQVYTNDEFKEKVFPSKEEAEQALKGVTDTNDGSKKERGESDAD